MKKLLFILLCGVSSLFSQNYGDSLAGWNEAAIKAELATHGVYGKEYFLTAPLLKRDYINKKYGLTKPINNSINSGGRNIGGAFINVAPCVNEDFESTTPGAYFGSANSTAVSGWSISSRAVNGTCNNTNTWNSGSSKFWVRSTPITGIPAIGVLGASPLGGTNVIQMNNNITPYSLITRISQTFPVTSANTVFQFAYAGVWQDGTHNCCEQPALMIKMYDCQGAPLSCSSLSLNAQGQNCPNGATGYSITNGLSYTPTWVVKFIDLTPFVGSCVTIEVINSDCIYSGHYGMVFFDAKCGGQIIGTGIPGPGANIAGPVSFCAGSQQAMISAPLGYNFYQWYGPQGLISAPQGTQTTLIIQNPVQGATYTVSMIAASGCSFTSVNVLNFTNVNIAGTNTTATCPGGASGTATVYGNGSGTGYNYSWTNSTNSVIGTSSVITGLAAGVYSITISGLGSSGCGTAVTTVTIPSQPVPLTTLIKPYCGNTAYFQTNGGTNIQWYNNTIPASTSTLYVLSNPSNGGFVHLRYTTSQGCQDSIKYILYATTPGAISILSNKLICPGGTNGVAVIGMVPATGAPPGFNNYSVTSTGTTISYSSSTLFSNLNTYTVSGLQAGGTYSVNTFDGSCAYTTNFTVPQHIWNYTLSAGAYSFCPGQTAQTGISFTSNPSSGQYTYSWSPTNWLVGNNGTFQQTIISPTTSPGTQTTIVYTVIVTPTISGCAITKTMAITAYNPAIPLISTIPNLCNNSLPYPIITSIQGGTFNTLPIVGGIIQPSLASIGINTFTYSTSVYTCVAKSTQTYEVSQFRSSTLTSTISPLCVTNSPFNLMTIVQSTVGSWFGTNVQNSFFNPLGLQTNVYNLTYSVNSTPNPTVCPSVSNIGVSVTSTIIPQISSVPEFCTNQSTISLNVNPQGGTWGGNSAVSLNGVITPSLATIPSSTVGYSITIGPCLNTAITTLFTSKFNTANITNTIPDLCYNSPNFNLMSIVQSTTNGNWSGMGVVNNTFIPSGLFTGNYNLIYNTTSSPNSTLCPDNDLVVVNVLNPVQPNITQVGPFCSKDSPIQLNVSPSTGIWQSTSYLNTNGLFNPSMASIGSNVVTYVIGTSTCNRVQTKNIVIESFVSSAITSPIPDLCNNSPNINLTPIVANIGGIWSGSGILGTTFNPNIGAGKFVLTYKTSSFPSGLCPDVSTIAVNVYSLALPVITQEGPFCNNSMPIKLNVSPVGGLFGGINNNAVDLSGIFSPAFAQIGANIISYSITSGPCVANIQSTISIEKFINADFEKQVQPFCNTSFPLNLMSITQNPGGVWSGKGIIGSMFYPNKANIGLNKVFYYTHSYPTATLCPDVDSINIEVRDIPKVSIISSKKEGCSPLEVAFNVPNFNGGNGVWIFEDGSRKEGFVVSHIYNKPGNYSTTFSYNDGVCDVVTSSIDSIIVYESPQSNFYIPNEVLIDDKVQFINLSTKLENNKYVWRIENNSIYEINPLVKFDKVGTYKINLLATTIKGCKDSISKHILVFDEFKIWTPKSFTPNYDGINDIFYPVVHYAKKYNLMVFDRWGELIYQGENGKWNGTFKDKQVQEGVYVWKILVFKEDGGLIEKMGHVTLLR